MHVLKLKSVFHHLLSVVPKQLCTLALIGCTSSQEHPCNFLKAEPRFISRPLFKIITHLSFLKIFAPFHYLPVWLKFFLKCKKKLCLKKPILTWQFTKCRLQLSQGNIIFICIQHSTSCSRACDAILLGDR